VGAAQRQGSAAFRSLLGQRDQVGQRERRMDGHPGAQSQQRLGEADVAAAPAGLGVPGRLGVGIEAHGLKLAHCVPGTGCGLWRAIVDLSSSRLVPAPPSRVWDALNDPETLKACIPGCDSFVREADGTWATSVLAKVGPVSARFGGRIELADVNPPTGYTLKFQGQGGAAGFAKGEAKVALAPADGGTTLSYKASAQVGGKLAQVGSRLIDGAAAKLADDFFARLAERLGPALPAAPESAAPALPAPAGGARWIRYAALAAIVALVVWLATKGGFRL